MIQPTLPLTLVRRAGTPLALQIATQVRKLVSSGALAPGDRLPSSRALAGDLGVARAVVEQAYDQMLAEGWLAARRGAGTFVPEIGALPATGPDERRMPGLVAVVPEPVRMDTGTPWVDPRHDAGWRRAWRAVSVARMPRGYPDPAGIPGLRAELAAYVSRTRGLPCGPGDVIVTAGTTHGLGLLLEVLGAGTIAVEDPGYRAAVATAEQIGWRVSDIPVGADGIELEALRRAPADTRAVYVTPAHQHPLGITMSAGRRIALLAEAARRGALVVEDDYDSEFRYDVAPLPSLASLDRDRVVYLGTASKSVHPALRIGWLVGPAGLLDEITRRRAARHDHPSWPTQHALLAMLREGHVDRLVRSARRVYARRSRVVAQALAPYGDVGAPAAGMYLTLRLPASVATSVRGECLAAGFDVPSLADYARSSHLAGLVIGFGGATDDELAQVLEVMTGALARLSPFTPADGPG